MAAIVTPGSGALRLACPGAAPGSLCRPLHRGAALKTQDILLPARPPPHLWPLLAVTLCATHCQCSARRSCLWWGMALTEACMLPAGDAWRAAGLSGSHLGPACCWLTPGSCSAGARCRSGARFGQGQSIPRQRRRAAACRCLQVRPPDKPLLIHRAPCADALCLFALIALRHSLHLMQELSSLPSSGCMRASGL